MNLIRFATSTLLLMAIPPLFGIHTAEAASIQRAVIKTVTNPDGTTSRRVLTSVGITSGGSVPFYTVTVEAKSPGGDEDLPMTESDAWLHGAAKLSGLPGNDATVNVTLYDATNAVLSTFSGTLGTDGAVLLAADPTKTTGCDATSRTGCDTSDVTAPDIELLTSEVFAASSGYELTLDLAGADTYAVAYAEIAVTETKEVTTCDKIKGCTTTGTTKTTTAEVGWDAVGSIWEADLTVAHEGVVEVQVTGYDNKGKKLESAKSELGLPWIDDGEGIGVVGTDEDPLTTVGMLAFPRNYDRCGWTKHCKAAWRLAVNSEGWSSGSAMPTHAQVEMTNGSTVTIPVNSYQRSGLQTGTALFSGYDAVELSAVFPNSTITITGGNFEIHDATLLDLATPTCSKGTCVTLVETAEGSYALSVSEYGSDAQKLADTTELTVTLSDEMGEVVTTDTVGIDFDSGITAVFANELSFSQDPLGLDLTGKVSLLGAPDKKGKQKTLAKGKFFGSFSRDGDGDLILAGADKDTAVSQGNVVVPGASVAIELTVDTNKDGVLDGPPLTPVYRNGSGTKAAASQTSTKPELL